MCIFAKPDQIYYTMTAEKEIIQIFKSYILEGSIYKGGKTLREINANGKPIYKLSSNENLLGPSPKAIAAIERSLNNLNRYPDRTGIRLQEALAKHYNNTMTADQFVVTPSGSEVLDLIIRGFLGEGLECIISNPCFSPYKMFSGKQGAAVIDIPLQQPDFSLDVEGVLNAINDKTRLIFITSPNNPTGTYIPKSKLDELVENVPEHVIIVMDEVYHHFTNVDDYATALSYVQSGKKIMGINSFSKAYGLAGLRLGYAYSTPELANYIQKLVKPFLINTLSLEAAIAALDDNEHLQKTIALIHLEKPRLYQALEESGIHYWKSQGNFILIRPNIDPALFESKMLEQGVMVRPVANFGAPGCVRVTIGTREANDAFIRALLVCRT